MPSERSRRRVLQTAGASVFVTLAGCTSFTNGSGESTTDPPGAESGSPSTPATDESNTATNESNAGTEGGESTADANAVESEVVDDFEDLGPWEPNNAQVTAASNAYRGSAAAKLVRQSGAEMSISRQVDLDLTEQNLSLAVRTDAPDTMVFDIFVDAPDQDNRIILSEGVRPSVGSNWFRIDPGATRVQGLPDLANVKRLTIRPRGGGGAGATAWVDDLRTVPSPDKPYVVLTFDDTRVSAYTEAFRIMSEHGMPGTVATIINNVGQQGYLNLDQMTEMKESGWEFASHTASHTRLTNISRLEAEQEIVGAKQWLVDNGFETGAEYIVYPYGRYDQQALNFIRNHHEMGFRFLGTDSAGSGRVTDPMNISRGDGRHADRVIRLLQLGQLYNDITILAFHRVGSTQNMGISTENFERIIAQIRDSDAEVITPSTLQQKLTVPLNGD